MKFHNKIMTTETKTDAQQGRNRSGAFLGALDLALVPHFGVRRLKEK